MGGAQHRDRIQHNSSSSYCVNTYLTRLATRADSFVYMLLCLSQTSTTLLHCITKHQTTASQSARQRSQTMLCSLSRFCTTHANTLKQNSTRLLRATGWTGSVAIRTRDRLQRPADSTKKDKKTYAIMWSISVISVSVCLPSVPDHRKSCVECVLLCLPTRLPNCVETPRMDYVTKTTHIMLLLGIIRNQ